MERKYMMYEGEDVNTIDLLYETTTTEANGVKVIVPVTGYDYHNFKRKISEQLAYFENVYFNVDGMTNDFVIVRTEHFQFSELSLDNNMHICLDNVYYPLDYGKLGIDLINLPIALRFSLSDGIFPTPNREAIRYTQEAKAIILKKLESAANYFVEKYNENVKDTDDFKVVFEYHTTSSRYLKVGNNGWDINPISRYATVKMIHPKMNKIKLLDLQRLIRNYEYILSNYVPKFIVNKKTMRDAKHYWALNSLKRLSKTVYYYQSDRISGVMKDYLKSISESKWSDSTIFRLEKMPLFLKGGSYNCYYNLLNLENYPKDQWRAVITEFQEVVKGITKDFINIDDIVIPDEFIESRKRAKRPPVSIIAGPKVRKIKLKGEVVCKVASPLERYVEGKNCKWVSHTFDMSKFHRLPNLFVYGTAADTEKMDSYFKIILRNEIRFIILSERELKVVKGIKLHNLMSFEEFMKGKSKPFQRIATACIIDKFYNNNIHLMHNRSILYDISKDLYNKLTNLSNYRSEHFQTSINNAIRDAIVEHSLEVNAFDTTIIDDLKAVETISKKLPFLNAMLNHMGRRGYNTNIDEQMFQSLVDLFKYHKHRIDWGNYNIAFNDDVPEEELTETLTEELV